ncbi:hypothetical protein F3Y22_tig00111278pilonHSYRG00033 [Hibiscus syriacus]|uniref:Phorbol-ester/DAG-type domain-containing protein n=1 Tax=Hibiscus syriacus TaxID=106335 RepID=A0A6A2YRG4_HIBSY|nr:hypothetical protein F3Y22_tig00111278pilonHSYRG00033 [Hibiscus syriacus]
MWIQHEIHEHTLWWRPALWEYCSACWRSTSGMEAGYGCTDCDKFFHTSCLDQLKPDDSFKHFTHFHPTKPVDLKQQEDDEVVCAICKRLCSSSSSSTNGCMECKFFIHKSCLTTVPPELINHLIHPCTLALTKVRSTPFPLCARCDSNCFNKDFFCDPCGFYLNVYCALDSIAESEVAKEIQHFTHPHPLSPTHIHFHPSKTINNMETNLAVQHVYNLVYLQHQLSGAPNHHHAPTSFYTDRALLIFLINLAFITIPLIPNTNSPLHT